MRAYDPLIACSCDSRPYADLCDVHRVPVVCICETPAPDGIGECRDCRRPYKPAVPGFDACRDAWRRQLPPTNSWPRYVKGAHGGGSVIRGRERSRAVKRGRRSR